MWFRAEGDYTFPKPRAPGRCCKGNLSNTAMKQSVIGTSSASHLLFVLPSQAFLSLDAPRSTEYSFNPTRRRGAWWECHVHKGADSRIRRDADPSARLHSSAKPASARVRVCKIALGTALSVAVRACVGGCGLELKLLLAWQIRQDAFRKHLDS